MDPLAHFQQPHSAPSASSSSASPSFAASASPSSAGAPSLVVSHEASQQQQQLDADHFGIPYGFDPSPSSLGPEQQQHFPSLSPGVESTGE